MDGDFAGGGRYRLLTSLSVANVILIITGIIISALGYEVDHFLHYNGLYDQQAPLWWIGIMPAVSGFCGVAVVAIQRKYLVVVWLVEVTLQGCVGYILLFLTGCLQPEQYGVNVDIFGDCSNHNGNCVCLWQGGRKTLLKFSTCNDISHLTGVYLSLVVALVVCLACDIMAAIMGCVAVTCLQVDSSMQKQFSRAGMTCRAPTVRKSTSLPSTLPSPITEEWEGELT